MPRIFDNIDRELLPALSETIKVAHRADFCVGYFNLRGWRLLAPLVERWEGGEGKCCRVLVGMHRLPEEELRAGFGTGTGDEEIDNQTAVRIKRKLAEAFRTQLTIGVPTNDDEVGLRQLAAQLRAKKVVVKLFLRHALHAKLYLAFRTDHDSPVVGYLGSSNLTMAGLKHQGELNVDVLEHDACQKLTNWFEERWADRWCIDISADLAQIIEESWARETPIPPHHIYVKIAYHLSHEARAGLSEFKIPTEFGNRLFEFQKAAVKIAAHHLNKRGGVLLGDVVGLGKTLMATAIARIFEDDFGTETLILCPKNLVKMWEDYRDRYRLHARVMSLSVATRELPTLRRYRLVLIDESHNLRNREGKRYSVIRDYLRVNDSRCILLSATPYNKSYLDLANQLRLFMPDDRDLGVRPERLLSAIGETKFLQLHQCGPRTLAAFEKSEYADDWRELMRLFLVRRTRSFIQDNYAQTDPKDGRKFLTFDDGRLSYFPTRAPKTVKFTLSDADTADQYALLYSDAVVEDINKLTLPRYGLGNYLERSPSEQPNAAENRSFQNLSRAGKRLMGFCRTNLFKRLESSGHAFVQSVERHLLRNYVYLHALASGLSVPIGTQEAELLDTRQDAEDSLFEEETDTEDDGSNGAPSTVPAALQTENDFQARAAEVYARYAGRYRGRFQWVRTSQFRKTLTRDLKKDNKLLLGVLSTCGAWNPARDRKLDALANLLTKTHGGKKVLIFSQFADTVDYLEEQLRARGVPRVAGATGGSADPTALAYRFSPVSNERRADVSAEQELNVLVATDVLSEGQNLQDCSVVVNYDLPWAIIRLVQRAGRVDRIGQTANRIDCYSFLPADGVERIIRLRSRVIARLQENAEVVGSDEAFFEGEASGHTLLDHLYNEKSGVLDGDADGEVDLASYAYQIWKNAITDEPGLQKTIPDLQPVAYSAKAHATLPDAPPGVLVYTRTPEGNDALAWINADGKSVTESQFAILKAATCLRETPAVPRAENHHTLVQKAVEMVVEEDKKVGGQLGRPSGARFKTYKRLDDYVRSAKGTLLASVVETDALKRAIDDLYRFPLRDSARETLNRQLKTGIADDALAELVVALREEDRLCVVEEEAQKQDAQIICSLGLIAPAPGAQPMPFNAAAVKQHLRAFEFRKLFNELGWDKPGAGLPIALDGIAYDFAPVAEKRGLQVFECVAPAAAGFPDYATRLKLERQVVKFAQENILVFTDAAKTRQTWLWVKREANGPPRSRQETYVAGDSGERLAQKLQHLLVELDEEEKLRLSDALERRKQAFDVEKVTKKFFERFKQEHEAFLKFIKGLPAEARAWYASLMLNRLMFVYFIQKKRFLDNDPDYLRNKLAEVQQLKGKDKFGTFYRHFLMRLFHEGLGKKKDTRAKDFDKLLGDVPYLNGGLFDVHELEAANADIQIPDKAFEKLFAFFGEWDWTLDDRPTRRDNEINPDVLGFIFEKYINQKQMGAYYTKEDITGYITRNALLPFVLGRVRELCAVAFQPGGSVWKLLKDDPDRYIYPAVRHGVIVGSEGLLDQDADVRDSAVQEGIVSPMSMDRTKELRKHILEVGKTRTSNLSRLPEAIAAGIDDVAKRDGWNKPAAEGFALPTETWREHVARRQRCIELRAKLRDGRVTDVNDLVTLNLDLVRFTTDVIEECEGAELLRAVYQTLTKVTVLDPTCGSGAFLFAALNILEPLYDACLERMQDFVNEADATAKPNAKERYADFRAVLAEAERHPNRRYFIFRSVVVNNLYGVDIMDEAVEICKLRLFLKLVSQVESAKDIEPLPDIDFNIRAGNTLVGFASVEEARNAMTSSLDFGAEVDEMEKEVSLLAQYFNIFRDHQTKMREEPGKEPQLALSVSKPFLRLRLQEAARKLDRYLAGVYGVDADDETKYAKWHESHKPFHWFAEFYGIMHNGGFDVVIGNPPWKEYAAVCKDYTVLGFQTVRCGNLHGICTERALNLRSPCGFASFIVQLPLTSSSRMVTVRQQLTAQSGALWVIPFDDRPGKLFDGLQHCRSAIFISTAQQVAPPGRAATRYQRWPTEAREFLFPLIEYVPLSGQRPYPDLFAKVVSPAHRRVLANLVKPGHETLNDLTCSGETKHFIFYQEATQYWVKATIGLPYYAKDGKVGAPAHGRYLYFATSQRAHTACAILNSSLFYSHFITYGDCFHLSDGLATDFPIPKGIADNKELAALNANLMADLTANAVKKTIETRDGSSIRYAEFYASNSKPIIDEIDALLAKHYGFSAEELDFIVNYDIKYRLGAEEADGDEE